MARRPVDWSKVETSEMWGATEVAEELGVRINNVGRVVGLPEPRQHLAGGKLWLADEIRAFAAERRERMGRAAA